MERREAESDGESAEPRFRRDSEDELRERTRQLEARVEQLGAELLQARSELDAYAFSISHDLRSPLGAILTFAAILTEDHADRLDPQGREWLERISNSARTAVSMMDSLLVFLGIGRQPMRPGPCDVEALVQEVVEELKTADAARASVSIGSLPGCSADEALLKALFTQLLSNALRFSARVPAPAVEIGGHETSEQWVYFVRDNGIGFEMKHAHRLFGLFERLHARQSGHGVGLAIAGRIVRRHGGRIWAESEPERGATFTFTVPKTTALP